MTAIPASDRPFLARAMAYFGIARLGVVSTDTPRSDIGVQLGHEEPRLVIGKKWRRNRQSNPALARKQLVHECIHIAGYGHNQAMRDRGYYSRDRRRDTLTDAVYADVSRHRRFDPSRFGLPAPGRRQ